MDYILVNSDMTSLLMVVQQCYRTEVNWRLSIFLATHCASEMLTGWIVQCFMSSSTQYRLYGRRVRNVEQ